MKLRLETSFVYSKFYHLGKAKIHNSVLNHQHKSCFLQNPCHFYGHQQESVDCLFMYVNFRYKTEPSWPINVPVSCAISHSEKHNVTTRCMATTDNQTFKIWKHHHLQWPRLHAFSLYLYTQYPALLMYVGRHNQRTKSNVPWEQGNIRSFSPSW